MARDSVVKKETIPVGYELSNALKFGLGTTTEDEYYRYCIAAGWTFATMVSAGHLVKNEESKLETTVNINLNKQEENIMTNRKIVTVSLIDNDPALDVSLSVVASFDNLVTEDSNEVLFQEILMNPEFDISGKIKEHNEKRTQQVDLAIKKATGNSVTLEPIKLKQLTWSVK